MASAETVLLPGGLTVRVPAVPALALLKLLTWSERRTITTRDAVDLATMTSWYSTGSYLDLLYEEDALLRIVEDDDVLGRLANDAGGARVPELMRAMGASIRHAVGS